MILAIYGLLGLLATLFASVGCWVPVTVIAVIMGWIVIGALLRRPRRGSGVAYGR